MVAEQVGSKQAGGCVLGMKIIKGDVVRLASSVTRAEFGVELCDEDGEMLEIDGVVESERNEYWVKVIIRRMIPMGRLCRAAEGAVLRRVRRDEVLGVIEGEARLWPDARSLQGVNDERRGKARKEVMPVMWTVGAEECPAENSPSGRWPQQRSDG